LKRLEGHPEMFLGTKERLRKWKKKEKADSKGQTNPFFRGSKKKRRRM